MSLAEVDHRRAIIDRRALADRLGALRAGGQVRRPAVGADEEVGPFEEDGRLGDGKGPRPVAEVRVRGEPPRGPVISTSRVPDGARDWKALILCPSMSEAATRRPVSVRLMYPHALDRDEDAYVVADPCGRRPAIVVPEARSEPAERLAARQSKDLPTRSQRARHAPTAERR